jgi:hypothetical protein
LGGTLSAHIGDTPEACQIENCQIEASRCAGISFSFRKTQLLNPFRLFGLLRTLAFAQAHAGAAAVFVDEFDAGAQSIFEMIEEFGFVLPNDGSLEDCIPTEPSSVSVPFILMIACCKLRGARRLVREWQTCGVRALAAHIDPSHSVGL